DKFCRRDWLPRAAALHARDPSDGLPREDLDDAAVRRFRLGLRHQCAVQVSARAWADRAFDGLRPADADGLWLRSSVLRGRSRKVRRRDFLAAGYGSPL